MQAQPAAWCTRVVAFQVIPRHTNCMHLKDVAPNVHASGIGQALHGMYVGLAMTYLTRSQALSDFQSVLLFGQSVLYRTILLQ